jgi:hypothetical protein
MEERDLTRRSWKMHASNARPAPRPCEAVRQDRLDIEARKT